MVFDIEEWAREANDSWGRRCIVFGINRLPHLYNSLVTREDFEDAWQETLIDLTRRARDFPVPADMPVSYVFQAFKWNVFSAIRKRETRSSSLFSECTRQGPRGEIVGGYVQAGGLARVDDGLPRFDEMMALDGWSEQHLAWLKAASEVRPNGVSLHRHCAVRCRMTQRRSEHMLEAIRVFLFRRGVLKRVPTTLVASLRKASTWVDSGSTRYRRRA